MAALEVPTTSTRPAILFDVDGTLIVRSPKRKRPHNPAHGGWIRSLSLDADIHYLSIIGIHAHEIVGKKLKLPEFDWINYPAYGPYDEPASRALAITALFPDRPVTWIDNELGEAEFNWAAERNANHAPTLLVKTDTYRGIQKVHVNQITAWVGGLALDRH